jgi:hypothetical protein
MGRSQNHAGGGQGAALDLASGETEIQQAGASIGLNDYILWFDISMEDAPSVEGIHAVSDILDPGQNLPQARSVGCHLGGETTTWD